MGNSVSTPTNDEFALIYMSDLFKHDVSNIPKIFQYHHLFLFITENGAEKYFDESAHTVCFNTSFIGIGKWGGNDKNYVEFFNKCGIKCIDESNMYESKLKLNVDCRQLNRCLARLAKKKLQTLKHEQILYENNNMQSNHETVAVLKKELETIISNLLVETDFAKINVLNSNCISTKCKINELQTTIEEFETDDTNPIYIGKKIDKLNKLLSLLVLPDENATMSII